MQDVLLKRLNVHHLTPGIAPSGVIVPRSNASLCADYEQRAEDYLFACLNGATPKIIIERAEKMFLAREALRDRGISLAL